MAALMIDYRARIEEAIQRVEAKSFELSSIISDLSAQHDRLIAARSVLDDMDMIFGREADTSSTAARKDAPQGREGEEDSPLPNNAARDHHDQDRESGGGLATLQSDTSARTVPPRAGTLSPAGTQAPHVEAHIETGGHTLDQGEGQHGAQALPEPSSGNEGGSAGRLHSSLLLPSESPASVPEVLPTGKPGGDADTSSPAPSSKPTLRQRILELHAAHPEYTVKQAVEALRTTKSSLSAYSSILKIKWRAEREPAGGGSVPDAASPAPQPIRPPVASPAPARPMPSGTLFRLTDGNGLYLHQSCTAMTPQVHYAWTGTADKLLAVRQKFPIARDLTEQVVLKSMRAA